MDVARQLINYSQVTKVSEINNDLLIGLALINCFPNPSPSWPQSLAILLSHHAEDAFFLDNQYFYQVARQQA